jgi:recombination protein RecT
MANTAITRYQPAQPVGSQQNLKALLTKMEGTLTDALPKHVTPQRMIKTMLVACNRTPDLLKCTQASILETINRAAELGLDLSGTLGEAYPVPFKNRVGDTWQHQATLIIGYRGLAKLARQSGEVARIDADIVCENDEFQYSKGSDGKLSFRPNLANRGKPFGAFAFVQFKDGDQQYDFMNLDEIEAIRKRSKSGSDRNGNPVGPWKTDWAEMAKKTVFRRLAKWLPLSAEKFTQAVELDNADYGDPGAIISVESMQPEQGQTRTEQVKQQIAAPQQQQQQSTQPQDGAEQEAQPDQTETAVTPPDDSGNAQAEPDTPTEGEFTEDAGEAEAPESSEPAKPLDESQNFRDYAYSRLAELYELDADDSAVKQAISMHCVGTFKKAPAKLDDEQWSEVIKAIENNEIEVKS